MDRIICDTNIWYNLGKDIKPEFLKYGVQICIIYNNIDELSISPNLFINYTSVKNACKSMFNYYQYSIVLNPIEYLIKLDNPNYNSSYYFQHYQSINKIVREIAYERITEEFFQSEVVKLTIQERKNELKAAAEIFMIPILNLRNIIKNDIRNQKISKLEFRQNDYSDFAKKIIKEFVNDISPTNYKISDNFNWNNVDLFIKVFELFLKELILSKKNISANDWYDIFNLVYVRKGDRFCTKENYWQRLITDSGMQHYLIY